MSEPRALSLRELNRALLAREAAITVAPFGRLAKADRQGLNEEGERLARFIAPDARAHRVAFT